MMRLCPLSFQSRMVRQQPEITGTAPPPSLMPEITRLMIGRDNMDKTVQEFLLHANTELQQHAINNLKAYEAILTYIGWITGFAGTEEQQETARAELKKAISDYTGSVFERSQRDHWSDNFKILNIYGSYSGWVNKATGAILSLFGADELGQEFDRYGDMHRSMDWHTALETVIEDYFNSVIQSLKDYWNWFWEEFDKNGLLIAVGKVRIDLAFLGAEIALDIAVSALTGGVGGVVSFVAKRVSITATRITIRAAHATARAAARIDGPGGMVFDGDIPPNINKMVDEQNLGGGTRLDDTAQRTQTKTTTPNTTVVKGRRGRNEAEFDVDATTGRPNSAKATLREDFGSTQRGDNATEIGKTAGDGYDGGHLIAHRFLGDTVDGGIAPQVANLNRGAWKTMENEWADWLTKYKSTPGSKVEIDVKIDVDPPGAKVPDGFKSVYKVYEVDGNGNRVLIRRKVHYFENKPGQTFDRVYFRDDGTIKK